MSSERPSEQPPTRRGHELPFSWGQENWYWSPVSFLLNQPFNPMGIAPISTVDVQDIHRLIHEITHSTSALTHFGDLLCRLLSPLLRVRLLEEPPAPGVPLVVKAQARMAFGVFEAVRPFLEGVAVYAQLELGLDERRNDSRREWLVDHYLDHVIHAVVGWTYGDLYRKARCNTLAKPDSLDQRSQAELLLDVERYPYLAGYCFVRSHVEALRVLVGSRRRALRLLNYLVLDHPVFREPGFESDEEAWASAVRVARDVTALLAGERLDWVLEFAATDGGLESCDVWRSLEADEVVERSLPECDPASADAYRLLRAWSRVVTLAEHDGAPERVERLGGGGAPSYTRVQLGAHDVTIPGHDLADRLELGRGTVRLETIFHLYSCATAVIVRGRGGDDVLGFASGANPSWAWMDMLRTAATPPGSRERFAGVAAGYQRWALARPRLFGAADVWLAGCGPST